MKHLLLLFLLLFTVAQTLSAQTEIEVIDSITTGIDKNNKLTIRKFDSKEFYIDSSNGNGIITIYSDTSGLKKIEEVSEFKKGRGTLLIYFDNGGPIKIIDREEVLSFITRYHKVATLELTQVFEATIYILDWEHALTKTIKNGERKFSEGTCAVLEYEPFIHRAKKLIN